MLTYNKLVGNPLFNLTKVFRYNGYRLLFPESSAEHSYIVSMISLILSEEFNKLEGDKIIDVKDCLYRSLIHDLPEVFVHDIISKVKKSSKELTRLISELEVKLMNESGLLSKSMIDGINSAKDLNTKEGIIVSIADRLSALMKVDQEYHSQYNNILYNLLQETYNGIFLALNKLLESNLYSNYKNILEWVIKFKEELLIKRKLDKLEIPDYSDSVSKNLWSKNL